MKRIIFDCDGTLIPLPNFNNAVRELFVDFNIEYQEKDINDYCEGMYSYDDSHIRYTIDEYKNHIDSFVDFDITEEMIKHYLNHAERLVDTDIDPILIESLEYLHEKGYEILVLTNYFSETQSKRLDIVGVLKYLKLVIGGEMIIKPYRGAYYNAAFGIDKKDVIFIGDSKRLDYDVPKSLGYKAILYDKSLDESNDDVINNFSYLRKIL